MMLPQFQLGQTGVIMALLNGGNIVLAHNGLPGKTIDYWNNYLVVIDSESIRFYIDNSLEMEYNYSSSYSKTNTTLIDWIASFNVL